jgi:hypothetical protein
LRPLTIILLVTAIAACFVAALAVDGRVVMLARFVYGLAFVGSILAFVRGLPRTPAEPEAATTLPRSAAPPSASAHG